MFLGVAVALGLAQVGWARFTSRFPPDSSPEGAYLRIAVAISEGRPRAGFAYLDYRKKASDRIAVAYPEPERGRLLEAYRVAATAEDGADVWLAMAEEHHWI